MTDLQMSLIAAGGVFIVGVFSYNKWQEYKARKSVERAFSTDHDDVLMRPDMGSGPSARHEPSFETDADLAGDQNMVSAEVASAAAELATSLVDPLID